MGRYWQAIKAGIAHEKQNRRPKLNRNEREFQAAAIEILETPASPAARIFAALIIVFLSGTLVWSWIGRIDTHASIQGKVIPAGKVKVIEPLITGTIKAIHVKAGDHVTAGDILIELDPTERTAERLKLADELVKARISAARLAATIDAVEREEPAQIARFTAPANAPEAAVKLQQLQMRQSLAAFQAEEASLTADIEQKSIELAQAEKTLEERRVLVSLTGDRSTIYKTLEKKGYGAKVRTIDAKQNEQDQLVAFVAEEGRLAELAATVKTLEARHAEHRQVYLDKLVTELVDTDKRIGGLEQDLAKAELYERSSVLKAPVSGRAQQLQVHTLGQVAQTGQRLMIIVPDGTRLEVEAMLLNKDKGFVREGQPVRIKLETFPFTKYGTLSGEVLGVSNDAIPFQNGNEAARQEETAKDAAGPLVFPIRISLNEETIRIDGADVAITPGMSVTAEVKTGDRRVIEFLLDPLLKMTDEAFRER